jgi:class 3 adenylate cyclase
MVRVSSGRPRLVVTEGLTTPFSMISVKVVDPTANKDSASVETVIVEIRKRSENKYPASGRNFSPLTLTETGPSTGIFVGGFKLTPDSKRFKGDIEVAHPPEIAIAYPGLASTKVTGPHYKIIEPKFYDPEFSVDKEKYKVGDTVSVKIASPSDNKNSKENESIRTRITSITDPTGFELELVETSPDSGVFAGQFSLSKSGTNQNSIRVDDGDTVSIRYECEFHAGYFANQENGLKTFFFSFEVGSLQDRLTRAEHVRDRLKRYVDPKLYAQINDGDELTWAKNKTVTIVFWDLRGFSKMCEILKGQPDLAMGFLKDYFSLASEIVSKNDGILDKFIGDGIMAIFGVFGNSSQDDKDAISAIATALEFKTQFESLVQTWSRKWSKFIPQTISVGLRCGVNTGEAMVGSIGAKDRDQFTALGSTVNIASRLEAYAKDMEILISATTATRVQGTYSVVRSRSIKDMKNIDGEFECFIVKGGISAKPKVLHKFTTLTSIDWDKLSTIPWEKLNSPFSLGDKDNTS